MGWPCLPGDPHAEGPVAPARESNPGREGKSLFYPRAQSLVTLPAQREEAAPPRAPGQSKPGQRRDFALPLRRRGSKARREAESQLSTATNPIGVFSFHPICESAVRGSRRRRRSCAGSREDAATPACRRRASGGARRVARRTGRRRGREPGAGARTRAAEYVRRREHLHHQGHLHHRERLRRPEHRRHSTDRPATTTSSHHREHRAHSTLSFPLVSFLCWIRDVETHRRCSFPECWPSRRRTAVPRWRELLSRSCSWAPSSPCDENVWDRPSCRGFLCRDGWVRRHHASSRAPGYQGAAPSGHDEAARAHARLRPRTGAHWTGMRG
jgi:hypothetical protein